MSEYTIDNAIGDVVSRIMRDRAGSFAVYLEPGTIHVREAKAAPPPGAKLHCIAQFWSESASGCTIQIRYAGGRSEFVYR